MFMCGWPQLAVCVCLCVSPQEEDEKGVGPSGEVPGGQRVTRAHRAAEGGGRRPRGVALAAALPARRQALHDALQTVARQRYWLSSAVKPCDKYKRRTVNKSLDQLANI